jgi:serine kinase of HPr protein (carbohydrate metabolism regulator)
LRAVIKITIINKKVKIKEIIEKINGSLVCGIDKIESDVEYAFASDLMSDVLTVNRQNLLLITGLGNLQAIRTAEISDISFLIFARNKKVTTDMKEIAEENGMVLIESPLSMFKISGELYQSGIKPLF